MKRVYLEITDSCNLSCPFCTYEKGHSFLSLEQIDDYTDQIKPYCDYIYLHILGEPLLHPGFDKILRMLDEKHMHLQLVTNGTLLNRYPDLLKHSCLRKLSVSLHSINNTNIGEAYYDQIDKLLNTETDAVVELRFFDKENLSADLEEYLEKLEERCGFTVTSKTDSYKLKDNVYVYFSKLFRWPDIDDEIISDEGTCHGAVDMIAINSRSEVTLCCLDPKAHNRIGDLKKDTLKDILESDLYNEYVKAFKEHRIISPLCQRCSYRLRFR